MKKVGEAKNKKELCSNMREREDAKSLLKEGTAKLHHYKVEAMDCKNGTLNFKVCQRIVCTKVLVKLVYVNEAIQCITLFS
jgi:hypothetical protein